MFLFHVDNKLFSQFTEKIADKSRIIGNWVFTVHRKNKSKAQITEKITAPITDHRNPLPPPPIMDIYLIVCKEEQWTDIT